MKYYSVSQIARMFELHYLTVWQYVKQGKLPASRIGKKYIIAEKDLLKFLDGYVKLAKR